MKHISTYKKYYLLALVTVSCAVSAYMAPINAYVVKVDGIEIGSLATEAIAQEMVDETIASIMGQDDYIMILQSDVVIEETKVKRDQVASKETLEPSLESALNFATMGYAIKVDGETLFTMASEAEATKFLNAIKRQNIDANETLVSSDFVEGIEVVESEVKPTAIVSYDEAWTTFEAGKEELLTYTIQAGDTTWDLVRSFKMDIDDLERVNPDVDLARLQIGQVINLNKPEAYINVKTVVTGSTEETILSGITYEKTDDMFVGEKKIKSEGANGLKKVNVEKTYINGILDNEVVISEEVVEEAVDTVLLTGTKWREVVAVGAFQNPANGVLTSRFGQRWGRKHTGIDIGAPKGTAIKAAADGIVVHVGNINGYGMTVKVDHGNGVQTLYGHASGYNVELGQVVSKNDVLAFVGNTGNTTGYCLHFEVRVNGTPVDPLEYVNY